MRFLKDAEEYLAGILLAAVTLLILAQLVLARLAPALASPLPPVVLALFFVATILGISAATARSAHLSLGLLSRIVSERGRGVLRAVSLIAALAFFAALSLSAAKHCYGLMKWQNRGWLGWCPDWAVALVVPLAAALSCLRAAQAWRRKRKEADLTRDA